MSHNSQMTMAFWLRVRHVWVHGFLIGLLLGVFALGAGYLMISLPSFLSPAGTERPPQAELPSQANLPAQPADPALSTGVAESTLELQLTGLIAALKENTLKKDLPSLTRLYSPHFPALTAKMQKIAGTWKKYDYEKMNFKIQKISPLSETTAVGWVSWDVVVKEIATGRSKNLGRTYKVDFIKEAEQWQIMRLENAPS